MSIMDIDTSGKDGVKKNAGVKKGKKLSTRVDLTPMVDLGFLLITFFMFTTTMSQPNSMHLNMPADGTGSLVGNSGAMTFWLGKNDNIYYYEGILKPDLSNVQVTNYRDVRQLILNKKAHTDTANLFMIVMPGEQSTYNNIVSILDEFQINLIDRYALVNKVDPKHEKDIKLFDTKMQ
jgi:biopolymer transport protein ExbD